VPIEPLIRSNPLVSNHLETYRRDGVALIEGVFSAG
jgi:hypothetical protein